MRIYLLILSLTLTVPPFATAQRAPYYPTNSAYYDPNPIAALIFVILLVALFVTAIIAICIHHCYYAANGTIPLNDAAVARPRRLSTSGLDPAVIDSFPILNYSQIKHLKIGKGELSCAVCVSEFEDNEKLRLLPKCDHVFHPECIDAWLASHSTCPICRANLSQKIESTQSTEGCNSTTEISEVQNQNEVSITVDENQGVEMEPRERVRMFPRPHSTGHSLVRLGEDCESYTLTLPEEVKRQMDGLDRGETSDRWFFTMTPPFFSRTGSLGLTKGSVVDGEVTAVGTSSVLLRSVKSPLFERLAGKSEQMSTRPPV